MENLVSSKFKNKFRQRKVFKHIFNHFFRSNGDKKSVIFLFLSTVSCSRFKPTFPGIPEEPVQVDPLMNNFMRSAQMGNEQEMIDQLLHGNLNGKDEKGWDAYIYAKDYGHSELANFILKGQLLQNINTLKNVELALNRGADFQLVKPSFQLQLLDASKLGDLNKVKNLLHLGTDLLYKDINQKTAIHYAFDYHQTKVFRFLQGKLLKWIHALGLNKLKYNIPDLQLFHGFRLCFSFSINFLSPLGLNCERFTYYHLRYLCTKYPPLTLLKFDIDCTKKRKRSEIE